MKMRTDFLNHIHTPIHATRCNWKAARVDQRGIYTKDTGILMALIHSHNLQTTSPGKIVIGSLPELLINCLGEKSNDVVLRGGHSISLKFFDLFPIIYENMSERGFYFFAGPHPMTRRSGHPGPRMTGRCGLQSIDCILNGHMTAWRLVMPNISGWRKPVQQYLLDSRQGLRRVPFITPDN
jgi:hypothetical protein